VFDDDFELDDDEDSGCDDDNNIYSYLGDPVLRRADLMVAALDEVDDDEEHGELMAAALDIDGEGEHRLGQEMNMAGSSLLDEDRGSTGQGNTDDDLSDRDVLAPYLVRMNSIGNYKQLFTDNCTIASVTFIFFYTKLCNYSATQLKKSFCLRAVPQMKVTRRLMVHIQNVHGEWQWRDACQQEVRYGY